MKLSALFTGAWAEQAKASVKNKTAENEWFSFKFADEAARMGLQNWREVREILLGFSYSDFREPNGARWFWKKSDRVSALLIHGCCSDRPTKSHFQIMVQMLPEASSSCCRPSVWERLVKDNDLLDEDGLCFKVRHQACLSRLARSIAAFLEATKGCVGRDSKGRIDEDRPCFELCGNTKSPGDI